MPGSLLNNKQFIFLNHSINRGGNVNFAKFSEGATNRIMINIFSPLQFDLENKT